MDNIKVAKEMLQVARSLIATDFMIDDIVEMLISARKINGVRVEEYDDFGKFGILLKWDNTNREEVVVKALLSGSAGSIVLTLKKYINGMGRQHIVKSSGFKFRGNQTMRVYGSVKRAIEKFIGV